MPLLPFLFEVPRKATDLRLTTLTLDPSKRETNMKIKRLLLSITLAGISLNQASAQGIPHPTNHSPAASRHVGDGVRSIGDTNRFVADQDDLRPESLGPTQPVSHTSRSRLVSHSNARMVAPTATCNNLCGATGSPDVWVSGESLLWFGKNTSAPALVTTSAPGVLPVAGAAGVTTQLGGTDGVDYGLLPGFRVSAGRYIDDCQKLGVGGRVFGIFSASESFSTSSDGGGVPSIGIPFYNLTIADDDAYLVAYRNGLNQPVSAGSVSARSDLDMIGVDGSLYILLGRSNDHRIDMLAGYSYNRLKNSAGVDSTSTNLFTGDLIPDGTVFTTHDLFETENIFHGAHLGVLSSVVRQRVSLSTLAKVSFGNMRQMTAARGFTLQDDGVTEAAFAGGIFTQQSNLGEFSRDTFAFIPELGVKLGLAARENLQLTVGYTFLFWSDVALAGDQIDSTVDLTQSLGGAPGTRPSSEFEQGSYWMQGIDLGMTLAF